eukprot:3172355-Rhodomonas_salina.1
MSQTSPSAPTRDSMTQTSPRALPVDHSTRNSLSSGSSTPRSPSSVQLNLRDDANSTHSPISSGGSTPRSRKLSSASSVESDGEQHPFAPDRVSRRSHPLSWFSSQPRGWYTALPPQQVPR